MPVSEEIRRENSRWVKIRNEWRKKYKNLSLDIAGYKHEVKWLEARNEHELANRTRNILRLLQKEARNMMADYEYIISGMLRATSYRYENLDD